MTPAIQTSYTAFAITSGRLDEIESYQSLNEAIEDILSLWPEDESDAVIFDDEISIVAKLRRVPGRPGLCRITYRDRRPTEVYRCRYEHDNSGRVRSVVERLG